MDVFQYASFKDSEIWVLHNFLVSQNINILMFFKSLKNMQANTGLQFIQIKFVAEFCLQGLSLIANPWS